MPAPEVMLRHHLDVDRRRRIFSRAYLASGAWLVAALVWGAVGMDGRPYRVRDPLHMISDPDSLRLLAVAAIPVWAIWTVAGLAARVAVKDRDEAMKG